MKLLVEEIRRLNNLLRDFSKLSKQETYDLHPTSLTVLAKEILDGEKAKYISKGIRVKLIFAPDLPLVLADRGKIKLAMLNLCKNAEEAMPEGGTLTRLRGFGGCRARKWLKNQPVGLQGLHYRAVAEVA